MTNRIYAFIRNSLAPPSYGGCNICGDKWNWKKEHIFKLDERHGAFPICEECWQTKSDERILEATKELTEKWLSQVSTEFYKGTVKDSNLLLKVVKQDLKKRAKEKKE